MTGGQMAPTTPIGKKSTTSPFGRNVWNEGYPLHISEVLSSLDAPVYIERVGLGNMKQIMTASKAIKKGIENQVKGLGVSLIEVLSPCPTIWKMQPVEAQKYVREELAKIYPLGVYRDRTKEAQPRPAPMAAPSLADIPKILGIRGAFTSAGLESCATGGYCATADYRIKIAGFGGQGVLMLGEVIAEAGLEAGLEVSWLPSYGPEMRSGTSNCHVRLSKHAVDSPLVSRPNVLLALNEPSLHKFIDTVEPGGWVLYNGHERPKGIERTDVRWIVQPFTELADQVGDARAGNILMLGSLLEVTGMLGDAEIDSALRKHVKTQRWLDLDRKALVRGREAVKEGVPA